VNQVTEITISDRAQRELKIIAKVKKLSSPGEAVDYLLDVFQEVIEPVSDVVQVYARYKGERVEGEFSISTHQVTVTSGDRVGTTGAPSTTAGKVIKSINPAGSHYCNGWLHFWKTQDGRPIDIYRHR
jgi:hypothetical protein